MPLRPIPPAVPVAGRAGRVRPLLPGWRPVAGGLLVTIAMLSAWTAGAPRSGGALRPYLVARTNLQPGRPLTAADVRVVRLALPSSLSGHVLEPGDTQSGATLLGPVQAGDLVARSLLAPARQVPASHEVSFAIERAWAVDGTLAVGERVDVLVTYGQGIDSQTRRVLRGVQVVDLSDRDDSGLGQASGQTITVAIADPSAVLAAVNAARAGTVTVVRASGASAPAGPGTYRPTRVPSASDPSAPDARSGQGGGS